MTFEFTDNSAEVLAAFEKQLKRGLKSIGETAVGYAAENAPVQTGRLKNSITCATDEYGGKGSYSDNQGNSYSDASAKGTPEEQTVYIGSNVEYAAAKEFGHGSYGGRHFLKNAAANHSAEYKNIMETSLKS